MSHKINNPESEKHVVAHNNTDTYHYAVVESGAFATGQPNMDVFDSEQAAYDEFGENLPARYQVVQTDDGSHELHERDLATPVDGDVVDTVALVETARDRYGDVDVID